MHAVTSLTEVLHMIAGWSSLVYLLVAVETQNATVILGFPRLTKDILFSMILA